MLSCRILALRLRCRGPLYHTRLLTACTCFSPVRVTRAPNQTRRASVQSRRSTAVELLTKRRPCVVVVRVGGVSVLLLCGLCCVGVGDLLSSSLGSAEGRIYSLSVFLCEQEKAQTTRQENDVSTCVWACGVKCLSRARLLWRFCSVSHNSTHRQDVWPQPCAAADGACLLQ